MAKRKIIWTPTADESFSRVLKYLQDEWTEKEIEKFIEATDFVVHYISVKPLMFRRTNKRNVHEALITEHNLLIYKIYPTHISLITFWDTRQNPKKKKHK